jgi:galactonate dehydratase
MRITDLRTLHADGGWRVVSFLRLQTDDGRVGWAEFFETSWSPGLTQVIEALTPHVVGRDPRAYGRLSAELRALTLLAPGGLAAQAVGTIENACIDLAAKAADVPAYALFGGPHRDRLRAYWSHCGTFRATHRAVFEELVGTPPLREPADLEAIGREVRDRGFTALKTNPLHFGPDGPVFANPGFAPGDTLDVARVGSVEAVRELVAQLELMQAGAGDGVEVMVDLNFSLRGEGLVRVGRAVEALGLGWIEVDLPDPAALADARAQIATPIASCETLYGLHGYRPYLEARAVDVAVVDVPWNGVLESVRIAGLAEAHEINVAPHNFYGHLATHINAHFAAAIPNFRILEHEVDDVPWHADLVTHAIEVRDGHVLVPDGPGWGCEVVEEAVLEHPPRPDPARPWIR